MSSDKDVAKAMKRLCVRTRCVCVCVYVLCLTCDPGATLAAYGSNWAARKLTKCQWSVVPQEVINCRASRAVRELCLYLFPATDGSVCLNHVVRNLLCLAQVMPAVVKKCLAVIPLLGLFM